MSDEARELARLNAMTKQLRENEKPLRQKIREIMPTVEAFMRSKHASQIVLREQNCIMSIKHNKRTALLTRGQRDRVIRDYFSEIGLDLDLADALIDRLERNRSVKTTSRIVLQPDAMIES